MEIKLSGENYQKRLRNFLAKEEVRAYTMAILSFFAFSFFTLFAIKPTLATLFNLKRQIADSSQIDQKLEEKINLLLTTQEEYQKYKSEDYLLEEALPKDSQFTSLIRKIEELAKNHSLTISTFQIEGFELYLPEEKKAISQKEPENFTFSLTLAGQYPQADSFLKKLLDLRRIIHLEDLEIAADEEEKINLTLKAKAYYLSSP